MDNALFSTQDSQYLGSIRHADLISNTVIIYCARIEDSQFTARSFESFSAHASVVHAITTVLAFLVFLNYHKIFQIRV